MGLIDPGQAPLGCAYWFRIVSGNAIIGYVLAAVNRILYDGWSHVAALAAVATTALLFWALDRFVLQWCPARAEIRRAVARILWITCVLQVLPVYDAIMGQIAIGFIGIHVAGISYKPVLGPVGSDWGYHAQVYGTALAMALMSGIPLIAYATIRGIVSRRLARSS